MQTKFNSELLLWLLMVGLVIACLYKHNFAVVAVPLLTAYISSEIAQQRRVQTVKSASCRAPKVAKKEWTSTIVPLVMFVVAPVIIILIMVRYV